MDGVDRWRVEIAPEGLEPVERVVRGVYPGDAALTALASLATVQEARHEHAPGLGSFTVRVRPA